MRAASSFVSLATHVMVVVAALWATSGVQARAPQPPRIIEIGPAPSPIRQPGAPAPAPAGPVVDGGVTIPNIPLLNLDGGMVGLPRFTLDQRRDSGPLFAGRAPENGTPWESSLVDELPVMLAGPVPAYPDLLRQAGIQGRVLLEAVVDTLGHVERGSIVVVATAHPGFVAPARQAVAAMLFRPARVRGRAVRVRVRIPMDFALRR